MDFHGDTVNKNLPANAVDTSSIPGLGACSLEPVSHNCWAHVPKACATQQEKPLQWEARAPQLMRSPRYHNQRKPADSSEDPA